MRSIDVMARLGGCVRNRVQTCRRGEYMPTRLAIPIDRVDNGTVRGRLLRADAVTPVPDLEIGAFFDLADMM